MFPKFLLGPLFDQHDDANGGGGAGDTQNSNQNEVDDEGTGQTPDAHEALLASLLSKLPDVMKPLISEQINTAVNSAIGRVDRDLKSLKKTLAPPPVTTSTDESPRERELRERLEAMETSAKQEREELQAKELDAEIKTAISGLPFQDADGKQIAYDYYKGKAQRDEDGNLVIGDKPLNSFIANHAPRAFDKFMQRRENVGGSGNSTNRNSAVKGFNIDQIRPGMSAEEDAMARQQLAAALAERNKNR